MRKSPADRGYGAEGLLIRSKDDAHNILYIAMS